MAAGPPPPSPPHATPHGFHFRVVAFEGDAPNRPTTQPAEGGRTNPLRCDVVAWSPSSVPRNEEKKRVRKVPGGTEARASSTRSKEGWDLRTLNLTTIQMWWEWSNPSHVFFFSLPLSFYFLIWGALDIHVAPVTLLPNHQPQVHK